MLPALLVPTLGLSQRAGRKREFRHVVAAGRFYDDEKVVFARSEIDLFDFDS